MLVIDSCSPPTFHLSYISSGKSLVVHRNLLITIRQQRVKQHYATPRESQHSHPEKSRRSAHREGSGMLTFTQIWLSTAHGQHFGTNHNLREAYGQLLQMSELCMRQCNIIVLHTIQPALHLLRISELSIPI